METDAPSQETDAGGGLSTAEIALIISIVTLLFGSGIIFRLRKYIKKRRKGRSQGGTTPTGKGSNEQGVKDSLLKPPSKQVARYSAGAGAAGSEGNVTVVDQSPNHQGCRDKQAAEAERRVDNMEASQSSVYSAEHLSQQTFYDVYLVSTSEDTPPVRKMKEMCLSNGWTFTTPFDSKLGTPVMKSIEDAILTCSHVILIVTEEDSSMKDGKYSMVYEMAMESVEKGHCIGGKVIPILCCDKESLCLRLRSLTGSAIGAENLEKRMIDTIDRSIREQREAGASNFGEGSDMMDVGGYIPDLK